ncbi:unnamed protein product [Rotaria sp. Silwood1]|nr:unnamed protein product [Rotaria sp. Silwood1]
MENHCTVKWLSGAIGSVVVDGVTASSGSSSSRLSKSNGVFIDSMQNFYVVDAGNGRIQFFPSGSSTVTTASSGWGTALDKSSCVHAAGKEAGSAGEIQHSQGLVADENDTMYIANIDHNVIVKRPASTSYTSAGTVVAGNLAGIVGSTSSSLNKPTSVTRDSQGNLYVVDEGNHRIQLFSQSPNQVQMV